MQCYTSEWMNMETMQFKPFFCANDSVIVITKYEVPSEKYASVWSSIF
jgi:hypothetical protein